MWQNELFYKADLQVCHFLHAAKRECSMFLAAVSNEDVH